MKMLDMVGFDSGRRLLILGVSPFLPDEKDNLTFK